MYAELLARPGVVEEVELASPVGFLALHGGIEPGTSEMAGAAARAAMASLYAVTQPLRLGWHVPSHRVDPARVPHLAAFLHHVEVVVSLHGYWRPDRPDALYLGGANRELARELASLLRNTVPELPVIDDLADIPPSMRGVNPRNPVNAARAGGVQVELPHRARAVDARWRGPQPTDGPAAPTSARIVIALASFAGRLAA